MSTDVRELLHAAADSGPAPKIDAGAILQGAQRRRRRHFVAGGGFAAVLAILLLSTVALYPNNVSSINATNGDSVVIGGVRLLPVAEHSSLQPGSTLTIAGDRYVVRRNGTSASDISVCTEGEQPDQANCLSPRPQAANTSNVGGLVSVTVIGDDVPMAFFGFTTLRPTYGLMYNARGTSRLHVAPLGRWTFYWGVLRPEHPVQQHAGHRTRLTVYTMSLRMAHTDGSGHITGSICLPQDLAAHCGTG